MALTLKIENESSLPDGGPLTVTVSGKRGIDIGRDKHLDWTLPDPTRVISGKHCEVRYQDGAYWLYDVSTNGTFVNRSDRRLQGPHRLRHGDRIEIGRYIISVTLDGEDAAAAAPSPADPRELWSPTGEVAPPISPKDLQPARQLRAQRPDFLDWAIDTPGAVPAERQGQPAPWDAPSRPDDFAWAQGPTPAPPPPDPTPPVPTPRRPGAAPADNPWGVPTFVSPEPPAPPPGQLPTPRPGEQPTTVNPAPPDALGPASVAPPFPPIAAPFSPTAPAPAPPQPTGAASPPVSADFVRRLAKGAGVPEEVFARRNPGELAEELGALMRLVVTDLKQLLTARAESKRAARSANQTMIQALENNPLKFAPTAEDALRIMFGPPTGSYLDARRTIEQSFKDLKIHQVKTYSAMQHAVRMLAEDLEPQAIEEMAEADRGLGAIIGSRKARLWDLYLARWDTMTSPHDDGMVDAFMLYFAECYDRGGGR
jgi:type VI secretion system protein ImpI